MIRLLFMIFVSVFLIGALFTNQEQLISLHFFWGMETHPIPLYVIVLGAFLTGLLFAVLIFVPGWIRSMLDRRKKSKRIEELEIDLDRIRAEAIKGSGAHPTKAALEEVNTDLA